MTRPARPWLGPGSGDACCDNMPPVPRWTMYTGPFVFFDAATREKYGRAIATDRLENPDRLWCRTCQTDLEALRDGLADLAPLVLRLAAMVVAFVPGIGSGVASVLGTAASLAEGKPLDAALVDGMLAAVPGGPVWGALAASGAAVLKGQRIDGALLAGAREAVRVEGGDKAAAIFDGVIAVCQGKSLQDAGFAALQALAAGNDIAERAAHYSEVIVRSVESGRPVAQILAQDLAVDVAKAVGPFAGSKLSPLLDRIKGDPSLLALAPAKLADLYGVPVAVARAARAIMRDGSEDVELRNVITEHSAGLTASASGQRAKNDVLRALVAEKQEEEARRAANDAIARQGYAKIAWVSLEAPALEPEPVAAPPPPASPLGPASSVAIGVGVGGAGLVLAWLLWRR